MKNRNIIFSVLFLALMGIFGVNFALAQWVPPSQTPPSGNVALPVNTGSVSQTKTGGFFAGSLKTLTTLVIEKLSQQELRFNGTQGNQWRLYSAINGGTNGALSFQNTTDDFGSNFTTPLRLFSSGNVRVGSTQTDPGVKLEVEGQVKISGGSPGAGKVLTSDATGLATWETPSGGTGSSLPSGTSGQTLRHNGTTWVANDNLFNGGTNVGVGTVSPGTKLHVSGNAGVLRLQGNDHVYQEFYPAGASTRYGWLGYGTSGSNVLSIINQQNGSLILGTDNKNRLEILGDGQVKISAGNPAANKVLTSTNSQGLATWQDVPKVAPIDNGPNGDEVINDNFNTGSNPGKLVNGNTVLSFPNLRSGKWHVIVTGKSGNFTRNDMGLNGGGGYVYTFTNHGSAEFTAAKIVTVTGATTGSLSIKLVDSDTHTSNDSSSAVYAVTAYWLGN